mgnify:CR=1 FL=1
MITVKDVIRKCERCAEKAKKKSAKNVVMQLILSSNLNDRRQVYLIDYRFLSHEEFKWITRDTWSNFHFCTYSNVKEPKHYSIFSWLMRPPCVLQSDNGRKFVASIINKLASLWPDCTSVNGWPRHPQSHGSAKNGNKSIEENHS